MKFPKYYKPQEGKYGRSLNKETTMKPEATIEVEKLPEYKKGQRLILNVNKGHAKKGDEVEVKWDVHPDDEKIQVVCCAGDYVKEIFYVKPYEAEPIAQTPVIPEPEIIKPPIAEPPAPVAAAIKKNPFIGDNYFLENPTHVLGEQTMEKGRFGSEWVKVEGTMADLDKIDAPEVSTFKPIENTSNLSTESIQDAITETIENEKEVLIKPKVKRAKKQKAETDIAAQEIYSIRETAAMYNTNISREEMEAYFFTKSGLKGYDYTLYFDKYTYQKETFIKNGLIAAVYNVDKRAFNWEYIYTYKSGNISKKISWHKQFKDEFIKLFGESQFERQIKWLEECRPKPKAFVGDDKIILLPHSTFAKEIIITELRTNIDLNGESSLTDAFIAFLQHMPPAEFQKSNGREIIDYYIKNKSIPIDDSKASKEEQEYQRKAAINIRQRTKEEGDAIFARFLNEELLPEDQAKISYLWNEKYNSIAEADLTKIPIGFRISKTFKDNAPLRLSPTQRQAVAFMMEKKSGLLAYGVGVGKGHLLTSDILTPTGYRKMGELKIDDEVIGSNGKATKITGVFPLGKIQCYEVTFSDGSKTQVSKDHLWKVQKIKNRDNKNGLWHVLETEEIISHGLFNYRDDYYYSIPMVQPIEFKEKEPLPLHPYVLGILIGDGCLSNSSSFCGCLSNSSSFCNPEMDIVNKVKSLLPDSVIVKADGLENKDWNISRKALSGENEVTNIIRALQLDVKSNGKFIPDIYKFSSAHSRLELLRGLLDSDGYIATGQKEGKKGCGVFYTTVSEKLANDIKFLIQSFGGTCIINTKTPTYTHNGERRTGQLAYTISIRLPKGIVPVSSVKQTAKFVEKSKYQPVRFIQSITDIGEHEAQCISVAAEDKLYVCEECIVTHNTLASISCISQAVDNGLSDHPLIVVPTNTYFKWLGEIQGYTDKDTQKYLHGVLPHLPKIVGLYNLNADIVRNEIKEYSEEEEKTLSSIELLIETINSLEIDNFSEKKLQEKLSSIYKINWIGLNAAYVDYITGLTKPMSAVKWVTNYFRTELNYKIYELGKIKSFPAGTIFVTTEQGIQKLGIRPENQHGLQSDLYTILSQGEASADKKSKRDIAALEVKIEQTISSSMKKAKLYVEDFGFDFVCFDESHYYKKIFTHVSGAITDIKEDKDGGKKYKREKSKYELTSGASPSSRALSAFVLSHFIQRQNDNRNVLHLTATPFTNSPLEIYSMLALTNYKALEDLDMANMVDFFDTFMKINYDIKYTASKKVVKDVVLTGFNNLTSLRGLIYSLIDKKDEGANIIRPDKHTFPSFEKGIETTIPMTMEQDEIIKDIKNFIQDPEYSYASLCASAVAEEINELDFDGMTDEQLVYTYNTTLLPEDELIYEDEFTEKEREDLIKKIKGAKIGVAFSETDLTKEENKGARILQALSAMRQVTLSPYTWNCKRNPEIKKTLTYQKYIGSSPKLQLVMGCIKSILDYHRANGTKPSGQVIYMNAGVEFFPLIKEYLVKELGLTQTQVGMVTGGMSKSAKENAKRMFLNGDMLVLIGSATISVGVDLQNNASALYNCYFDWNPTDAQQIEGRIWRQGNKYSAVRIVYPMCYNSVDPVIFQYLQEKTSRINEIWNRDGKISELDLRDFNPKQLQKDLITDPEEKADWEILEESEKMEGEIIYLENRLASIEDAQHSIITMNEERPEVKVRLTSISKMRAEIKQKEAIEGHLERREAIIEKHKNNPAKQNSELAKHKKEAYDYEKDPDQRYVPKDFSNASDQDIYAECKRASEWLEGVHSTKNTLDILGNIFYDRYSIIETLKRFRSNFKDYMMLVDRVLIPLGLDINNIHNPIGEVKKKLDEKREQLENIKLSKPDRVIRIAKEQSAKKFNVSVSDRVKEFSKFNYLLDLKLPDSVTPKITLEEKLIRFRDALLKKFTLGGPTKEDHEKAGVGGYEYKSVNVRSLEGLLQAERLKREGWQILTSGTDTIQFERKKHLGNPPEKHPMEDGRFDAKGNELQITDTVTFMHGPEKINGTIVQFSDMDGVPRAKINIGEGKIEPWVKLHELTKWGVYIIEKRKRFEIIDTRTEQRWANEFFKTRDKAREFCKKNNLPLVEHFTDGGPVGGRGWGEHKKGKRITSVHDFKVGHEYLEFSKQFNAKNVVEITSGDKTPLKRDIVYGSFVRAGGLEENFAIWGHDLKDTEFYEIKGVEYKLGGEIPESEYVEQLESMKRSGNTKGGIVVPKKEANRFKDSKKLFVGSWGGSHTLYLKETPASSPVDPQREKILEALMEYEGTDFQVTDPLLGFIREVKIKGSAKDDIIEALENYAGSQFTVTDSLIGYIKEHCGCPHVI